MFLSTPGTICTVTVQQNDLPISGRHAWLFLARNHGRVHGLRTVKCGRTVAQSTQVQLFDLAAVARRNLYRDRLADTERNWAVISRLTGFVRPCADAFGSRYRIESCTAQKLATDVAEPHMRLQQLPIAFTDSVALFQVFL